MIAGVTSSNDTNASPAAIRAGGDRATAEGRQAYMDCIVEALRRRELIAADPPLVIRCLRAHRGRSLHVVGNGNEAIFVKEMDADWGLHEARIQAAAAAALPDLVPSVLAELPEIGGFAMARASTEPVTTWQVAAAGASDREAAALAERVGDLLGRYHRRTLGNGPILRAARANKRLALRQRAAYLRRCVALRPELGALVRQSVAESFARADALVHGDFNSTNVLLSGGRFVLIDFEKAWVGDAAFDAAWMVSNLIDRALRDGGESIRPGLPDGISRAIAAWRRHVDWEDRPRAEARAVRLALIRHLARHHFETNRATLPPAREGAAVVAACVDLVIRGARDADALAAGLVAAGIR